MLLLRTRITTAKNVFTKERKYVGFRSCVREAGQPRSQGGAGSMSNGTQSTGPSFSLGGTGHHLSFAYWPVAPPRPNIAPPERVSDGYGLASIVSKKDGRSAGDRISTIAPSNRCSSLVRSARPALEFRRSIPIRAEISAQAPWYLSMHRHVPTSALIWRQVLLTGACVEGRHRRRLCCRKRIGCPSSGLNRSCTSRSFELDPLL